MIHRKFASNILRGASRRRPAGVSRRLKHRRLQFESLEDRRVMSANPVTYGADEIASQMRDVLLDSRTLADFARVSDLSQYTQQQLASTEQWIVLAAEGVDAGELNVGTGVRVAGETGILPGSFVVDTASNGGAQQLVDALSGSTLVDYFYPLISFQLESLATPNDPLLANQWSLINFGQNVGNPDFAPIFGVVDEDINIEGAWEIVTGEGVVIGIVDSGVLVAHPDLAANIRNDLSVNLLSGGTDPNPLADDAHGTAVAGIAAGVGNNGIGITGVAYNADIAPIRLFSESEDPAAPAGVTDFTIAGAFSYRNQEIDIYNHSWGLLSADPGNPRAIIELGPDATIALRNSVFFGRKVNPGDINGLGAIHVFAAGNSSGIDDGGNYSELVNSRYTIGVTSVIETGGRTAFAEAGSAVLVAAPSGSNPAEIIRDEALGSGIYSTDLLGDAGFNEGPGLFDIEIDSDFLADTDYTSRFGGTSASAPIVSGIIALMLEANPSLTYRDVQAILVRSARQNLPNDISWITNNQQLFNDPLAFDSDPDDNIHDGAWPFALLDADGGNTNNQVYYQQPTRPDLFTNGAGYTVSQLTANNEYGFAHGVVDATLAVELARNWVTLGNQTSEFTWTTGPVIAGRIRPSAISSDETGEFRIPGGVAGGDGDINDPNAFIDFFNEFGEEDDPEDPDDGPFSGDEPPVNTRDDFANFNGASGIPLDFFVGPNGPLPAMSVEWVEVELDLFTGDANAYDFLRIVLVSPDGTQSDLKNYTVPTLNGTFNDIGINVVVDPIGSITTDGSGNLNAVFTTNRNWGERTENKIRLNTDGTPVRSFDFSQTIDANPNPNGVPIVDGWRLVFENYGTSVIDIGTYEVAFHGVNLEGTGRVQGRIGVDDNGDGVFSDAEGLADNFTRYTEVNLLDRLDDPDPLFDLEPEDPGFAFLASSDPYIQRSINLAQESWAAGVIVYVDTNLNGERDVADPSYQVGADGNYYFDLPVGDFDIRIDPNSLSAAGLFNQQNLDIANAGPFAQVTIAQEGEQISGFAVEGGTITATEFEFVDNVFVEVTLAQTSVPDLNTLLIPNATPDDIINLSGFVYSDLNGNGVQDADDGGIEGATVFIDTNQNGIFTPGADLSTTTDANGFYEFVDQPVVPGFYSVEVLTGTTGAFDSPVTPDPAKVSFFLEPGFANDAVDFGFETGDLGGAGGGVAAISGIVFSDGNENGVRDAFESGTAGIATLYLDLNDSNTRDAFEPTATPSANGSYTFNSLLAGLYVVRIEFDDTQYMQTTPAGTLNPDGTQQDPDDFELRFTVSTGQVSTGRDFGLFNLAVADFGDLPSAIYSTTLAQDGARHTVFGDLFLGNGVDAELDGPVGSDGTGDDTSGIDDEDGITFSDLLDVSTTITVTVDANTNGGFLQGWMDFNENGIFETSERVFTDELLVAGVSVFIVDVPAGLTTGTVYARFRYGEQGIDSVTGLALQGEVEDYAIPVISTAPGPGALIVRGPDFDEDGDIDGADFLSWQRGFGTTSGAEAGDGDSNGDGDVDGDDLTGWSTLFGIGTFTAPLVVESADFDSDGDTDGADFLAWQRGFGDTTEVSLSTGDANSSGNVDGADLSIWEQAFGSTASSAAAAASSDPPPGPAASSTSESDALAAFATANLLPTPVLFVSTASDDSNSSAVTVAANVGGQIRFSNAVVVAQADTSVAERLERQSVRDRVLTSLTLDSQQRTDALRSLDKRFRSSRSEDRRVEHPLRRPHQLPEHRYTPHDRALDHLFAGRRKGLLEEAEVSDRDRLAEHETGVADAFAAALGEQVDWRFG